MKVSRDVILDLWPVYEAGEASADTRALIEQFLHDDPEFAALLKAGDAVTPLRPPDGLRPSPDHELETLRRSQKLTAYRQQSFLLTALLLMMGTILRIGRPLVLGAAAACLLAWLVLVFFGRRLYRL